MVDKKSSKKPSAKPKKEKIVDMEENNGSYEKSKKKSRHQKLYLSNEDKMIAGVCGGLGEYFDIDAIWMRLIFIVGLFTIGPGALITYIVLWIVVPENPKYSKKEIKENKTVVEEKVEHVSEKLKNKEYSKSKSGYFGGLLLITIGAIFLYEEVFGSIDWDFFWPVILIALGVYLLVNRGD